MTKRPKRPQPRKIRRNPLARVLASGKFRNRIVKPVGLYKRRAKHRRLADEIE